MTVSVLTLEISDDCIIRVAHIFVVKNLNKQRKGTSARNKRRGTSAGYKRRGNKRGLGNKRRKGTSNEKEQALGTSAGVQAQGITAE